jgi:hypothetical protein
MFLVSSVQNRLVITLAQRGEYTLSQALDSGSSRRNRLILDLLQGKLTEEHPRANMQTRDHQLCGFLMLQSL